MMFAKATTYVCWLATEVRVWSIHAWMEQPSRYFEDTADEEYMLAFFRLGIHHTCLATNTSWVRVILCE